MVDTLTSLPNLADHLPKFNQTLPDSYPWANDLDRTRELLSKNPPVLTNIKKIVHYSGKFDSATGPIARSNLLKNLLAEFRAWKKSTIGPWNGDGTEKMNENLLFNDHTFMFKRMDCVIGVIRSINNYLSDIEALDGVKNILASVTAYRKIEIWNLMVFSKSRAMLDATIGKFYVANMKMWMIELAKINNHETYELQINELNRLIQMIPSELLTSSPALDTLFATIKKLAIHSSVLGVNWKIKWSPIHGNLGEMLSDLVNATEKLVSNGGTSSVIVGLHWDVEKSGITIPECAICYEPLEYKYLTTFCKHQFHLTCLMLWAAKSSTCPVCRCKIK